MPNDTLVTYIRQALAAGKSKEDIYKNLLSQNWSIEDIQAGFAVLNASVRAPSAPAAPVAPAAPAAPAAPKIQSPDQDKKPVKIFATIGIILIAAGIFSFIAANWQYMDKSMKVIIILVAMVVVYAIGWHLKVKKGMDKTGEALLLLGSIIYGSGIFLVAQIFNIRANWPDGFILWMLGAVIMGFAIESYGTLALSLIVGIIAIIGHPFDLFNMFGTDRFIMTSTILLAVSTIVTFAAGLKVRKQIPENLRQYLQ